MRSLASLALLPLLTAATIPSTHDLGKAEGRCRSNEPGPAFIVIPAGLAILGIEFAWARIWLKKAKAKAQEMAHNFQNRNGKNPPPS